MNYFIYWKTYDSNEMYIDFNLMTWKRFENFINNIKIFIIQCNKFHCNCNLLLFCFVLLAMGLGLRFCVFSSYGSPFVHSALWGVLSCLDSCFFFFSPSCSIAGWLSFIYLFIYSYKQKHEQGWKIGRPQLKI